MPSPIICYSNRQEVLEASEADGLNITLPNLGEVALRLGGDGSDFDSSIMTTVNSNWIAGSCHFLALAR